MSNNPFAAENNLHHTQSYVSDEEEYWDMKRQQAEAEYFAQVDPQLPTTSHVTIVDDTATVPF